ncbi:DeoR family transcriptional regulator [bacterium]|nr:DeoR family transcriptional regulator [bacterium]
MKKANLPKPVFDFDKHNFSALLRSNKKFGKNVPENVPENRLRAILDLAKINKKIAIPAIAKKLNVNEKTVKRDIAKLKQKNLLKRIGPAKGGHWEIINK